MHLLQRWGLTISMFMSHDARHEATTQLRILFAVLLVAMIAGCETVPSSGPAALTGQWTNSLGTVWTINPDGTFHVAATNPKAQIWGTYTVSGDTMTVQDSPKGGSCKKLQRRWRV